MVSDQTDLRSARTELDLEPEEFRRLGHQLVDRLTEFLETLPSRPVTSGLPPEKIRALVAGHRQLPEEGRESDSLLSEATELLIRYSLFNGHPRFWGYITSSPAPLGALADLLASLINPNVGGWTLSPVASEIEAQTVRWIADLIGFPSAGGLLASGGNLANMLGFWTARACKADWNVRETGMGSGSPPMKMYVSSETHTWIQKAADLSGIGTSAISWIPSGPDRRIDLRQLEATITRDKEEGAYPFLVVGNAGTVGTGAVDPLSKMAEICRKFDLWFHVDGAYGGLAARVPGAPPELAAGIEMADSVAVDPHKWLYSPLEAGCFLVRREEDLYRTFSYRPSYYHLEEEATNYFECGIQNSRGFRALKVWLCLQQAGRQGYLRLIGEDMALARELLHILQQRPDFEALSTNLSITTFRYVPERLRSSRSEKKERYLDELNREILSRLETGGEIFLSNVILDDRFYLRSCIVNFRTRLGDLGVLPEIVSRVGREVDQEMNRGVEGIHPLC